MSELPLTTGYGPLFLNSVLIPLTLPELKIMCLSHLPAFSVPTLGAKGVSCLCLRAMLNLR